MSSKTKPDATVNVINEVESPVLYRDGYDVSYSLKVTWDAIEWACVNQLESLFDLKDANHICFVAKSRGDRSTYKVVLDPEDSAEWMIEPVEAVLYQPLFRWLKKQITAGRPHIGVRIIK